jgi:hypothetical protein
MGADHKIVVTAGYEICTYTDKRTYQLKLTEDLEKMVVSQVLRFFCQDKPELRYIDARGDFSPQTLKEQRACSMILMMMIEANLFLCLSMMP